MEQKKGFLKGALTGALIMALAAAIVSCGLKGAGSSAVTDEAEQKISELKQIIDDVYLRDVDEEALADGLYKGYMQGLDDPYAEYYTKEEAEEMNESMSGEFSGVGAVLSQDVDTQIITVVQVYEDSPAEKAGIKARDIIYKVDGKSLDGKELSEVTSLIQGEKGTKVEITVLRGSSQKEVTVTAVRDKIETPTVTYDMLEDGVAYLAITEFDTITSKQYKEAVKDLEKQGMEGLIVDLRNNPGGNLDTVCEILDEILPEGLIVYTEDKNGKKTEYTSDEEHQLNLPITVLMNGQSASASEIFAGAIQDYGMGEIVGTQSYGKGVVQELYQLDDGTMVKLTTSEYFTPKGRNIDGEGITPDVKVELDADNPDSDTQLEKAEEIIKKQL